jgi:hypothetical protein
MSLSLAEVQWAHGKAIEDRVQITVSRSVGVSGINIRDT